MNEGKGNFRDEIFSKSVRAGKRTYFFDVKSTRGGDLYLTITESKKRFQEDGTFYFEKHKLFLYKEDTSNAVYERLVQIVFIKYNFLHRLHQTNRSDWDFDCTSN